MKTLIPKFETRGGACVYPMGKDGSIANEEAGYHSFETLSGIDSNGELKTALIGVLGASKHILSSQSYDRITPRQNSVGYHDFEIRDGELFGRNGTAEHDLGTWPPASV